MQRGETRKNKKIFLSLKKKMSDESGFPFPIHVALLKKANDSTPQKSLSRYSINKNPKNLRDKSREK